MKVKIIKRTFNNPVGDILEVSEQRARVLISLKMAEVYAGEIEVNQPVEKVPSTEQPARRGRRKKNQP